MGYPVLPIDIRLGDPYVILDYGDRYLDVQDHLTHCVSIDIWCDLRIHTVQPCHNILVVEQLRELTLLSLYLTKYHMFTFTAVE